MCLIALSRLKARLVVVSSEVILANLLFIAFYLGYAGNRKKRTIRDIFLSDWKLPLFAYYLLEDKFVLVS